MKSIQDKQDSHKFVIHNAFTDITEKKVAYPSVGLQAGVFSIDICS